MTRECESTTRAVRNGVDSVGINNNLGTIASLVCIFLAGGVGGWRSEAGRGVLL